MPRTADFQVVIDRLLDEAQPFPPRYLYQFSDIDVDNLGIMLDAWPKVPAQRKRTLLEDLEDLAETNTLLCFDNLARALLDDPDAQVRVLAIRLLWECQDSQLIPTFLRLLRSDPDVLVRSTAASALGLFVYRGELEEIPEKTLREIENGLLAVVQSRLDDLIRRRALEALGASSRAEVSTLIEKAFERKNPDWTASALYAMGRSSDPAWKKHVLSRLRDKNDSVRIEAIQAAGELSLDTAGPVLLNLLDDEEDESIFRQIIWALSKIGGEGVRQRLEELLVTTADDEETGFLEEALDNLAFTEDMQSFDLLDLGASDDNQGV